MIAQQRFIPKQFLEHLGRRDIGKVLLGDSVAMNMSVLFSDLRKFTPLVESNPPKTVIQLLNSYYEAVGKPIDEHEGFIGSYSGDEIMALFAVPPVNAVRAGIKMSEALWEFNAQSGKLNRPELRMGIGLNSGPLVLGTMGGGERIQCAVLGDTVNLASRIEQLTKSYQSQFLIGEKTYDSIKDNPEFSLRMVDYVAVKGKDHAVKIYEVLNAEEDQIRRQKEESKSLLENGMNAYFGRDFASALQHFEEGSKMYPNDQVFEIFKERSRDYLTNPPDSNWQGFTKLHNK